MPTQFGKLVSDGRLAAALVPIGWNLALGVLTLIPILIFGHRTDTFELFDFLIEFLSAVAAFMLFAAACFFSMLQRLKRLVLVGLLLMQFGRALDAADEMYMIPGGDHWWSTLGDVFTLVSFLVLAYTAIRWILASNARANTDPLTELTNRRYHESELSKLIDYAAEPAFSFAVVGIDLDNFKAINDTHGHAVGDEALRHTAHILRGCSRQNDVVSRVGGEEFEVLLPGVGRDLALSIAERIRARLEEEPPQSVDRLTASIGVAICETGDDGDTIRKRADEAVYASKAAGKNTVTFLSQSNQLVVN